MKLTSIIFTVYSTPLLILCVSLSFKTKAVKWTVLLRCWKYVVFTGERHALLPPHQMQQRTCNSNGDMKWNWSPNFHRTGASRISASVVATGRRDGPMRPISVHSQAYACCRLSDWIWRAKGKCHRSMVVGATRCRAPLFLLGSFLTFKIKTKMNRGVSVSHSRWQV